MRRPFPTALAATLAALGVLSCTGCGLGVDSEPRALQVPSTTTTTTPAPSTGQVTSILYYVNEGKLVPVATELPDRELTTVLEALLQPASTSLSPSGTLSSIPAGTELLGLERSDRRLSINLSPAFDNVVGLSRQQAIGQMVLTVTERNDLDAIEFRVDGEPIQVASPVQGDTRAVSDCDFVPLLATSGDADDAGLSSEMTEVLSARSDELAETC
jgi:hypothetical protein